MISSQSTAQIMEIKKNDPAYFNGVIMPDSSYRILLTQAMASDGLKAELDICSMNSEEPKISGVTWFMSGSLLGLVAGFALVKHY